METKKLYKVIIKAGFKADGSQHFVKYGCSDLLSLVKYLDQKFPNWCWFNVYCKRSKKQIASFTKNKRPTRKHV